MDARTFESALRCARKMNCVGIGEEQPITLCGLCAEPERIIFADPALRQFAGVQKSQLRNRGSKPRKYLRRAIGGLVIDDNNLRNLRLRGKACDRRFYVFLFVSRRNDG